MPPLHFVLNLEQPGHCEGSHAGSAATGKLVVTSVEGVALSAEGLEGVTVGVEVLAVAATSVVVGSVSKGSANAKK